MNEDLADILEQALQYAMALPVSPCTEDTGPDLVAHLEEQTEKQNDPEISIDNQDRTLHHSEFSIQMLECPEKTAKNSDVESLGNDIPDNAVVVPVDFVSSIFTEQQHVPDVTEVHSDSLSDSINDINDINEIDNISIQIQNDVSRTATSDAETDDVRPIRKRRRKREKNPGPPPETILPPCSICDEKSSGYHYGVNTCEACKGFFRRTLKKKEVRYKCKCKPDEKEDWKRGPFKNGCPACRYERCLVVGMSKNAIKIGRYTLVHKTKNINEVKSIEEIDSFITTLTQSLPETSPSQSGIDMSHLEKDDVSNTASALNITENPLTPDDVPRPIKRKKTSDTDHLQESCLIETFPEPPSKPVISLKEIDSVVKKLTEAHTAFRFDGRLDIPTEILRQRQKEYAEKHQLKVKLFGNMRILSKEEFREFYETTGMDIDGRIEQVHTALQFFEKNIASVVDFAKAIPGFAELSLDDQANLVKASRVENAMVGSYKMNLRNVNMERRVFTTPWGTHMHLDELSKWIPVEVLLNRRKLTKHLVDLNLTVQEDSILRAILIVSSDRCRLDDPEKVDNIQARLIACLQHLLNIRTGGPGTLLYKIFTLVTNLRELTDKSLEFAKRFFVDWPMVSSNYELLKEFIT